MADKRVAVLMAEGYEEGETLTIVDILRRAGLECHTFAFSDLFVKGMQGMVIKADKQFPADVDDYDAVVLPGGRPGGPNLIANPDVISLVQRFNAAGKLVAAMCFGTQVLEAAKVIDGRRVTGYTGYAEKLPSGQFVADEVVVTDQNLITSQGPATPYPFAYRIAEYFGKSAEAAELRHRMMYDFAGGK